MACQDKWAEIETLTGTLERSVIKGGNRTADIRVLDKSKIIAAWKNPLINSVSISALKQYITSIKSWQRLNNDTLFAAYQEQQQAVNPLSAQEKETEPLIPLELKTVSDSLKYFEALYLALSLERDYHYNLHLKVNDEWWPFYRTSKFIYRKGDTIKLIAPLDRNPVGNIQFSIRPAKVYFDYNPTTITVASEFIDNYIYIKFTVPDSGTYNFKATVWAYYPETKKKEIVRTFNIPIIVH
jgi:hypothetical protein